MKVLLISSLLLNTGLIYLAISLHQGAVELHNDLVYCTSKDDYGSKPGYVNELISDLRLECIAQKHKFHGLFKRDNTFFVGCVNDKE